VRDTGEVTPECTRTSTPTTGKLACYWRRQLLSLTTLSLQTAWTSFDPYLYSGESSPAGLALVENSNCKVFYILNRGIVTDTMSVMPLEPGWCAVHSTPSRLLSARSVPCGWAYRPVRIDCQGKNDLAPVCPPRYPNSLWLSY